MKTHNSKNCDTSKPKTKQKHTHRKSNGRMWNMGLANNNNNNNKNLCCCLCLFLLCYCWGRRLSTSSLLLLSAAIRGLGNTFCLRVRVYVYACVWGAVIWPCLRRTCVCERFFFLSVLCLTLSWPSLFVFPLICACHSSSNNNNCSRQLVPKLQTAQQQQQQQ